MRAMRFSAILGALALALPGLAADPPPEAVTAKAEDLEITARLILDREAQIKAVGSDLNRQYVLVELTLRPRGGYPVAIRRDDFLLRSGRDNERSTGESPDRIAGGAVLVLGSKGGGRGIHSEAGDPVFVGGLPIPGGGQPRRMGTQDNSFGNAADAEQATVTTAPAGKPTPLLEALKQKELPQGEARKPVTGLLYFPVDPKQKAKNFWLHYKGPGGVCELRFK